MNKKVSLIAALGLVLSFLGTVAIAQSTNRKIAIIIEEPSQKLSDFSLDDCLYKNLTMDMGLSIIVPKEDSTLPEVPNNRFDLQRLIEWGHEVTCRYILYLRVEDHKIVTRKKTSIPFILSRYIVEGQIDGSYCLIDLNRNKVVDTWDLKTRKTGARQWQPLEDYPDDPDLHIPAPRKMALLKELEEKAVEEIVASIQLHLKGR